MNLATCRARPLALASALVVTLTFSLAAAQPQTAPPPPAAPSAATDAPEKLVPLSLRQAVETAIRADPQVIAALVAEQRGRLGALRAQLDRFSLQVNAILQEQWRAANIFGSPSSDSCGALLSLKPLTGANLFAPLQLVTTDMAGNLGAPTQADCNAAGGQFVPSQGVYTSGIGLLNISASLTVPLFTGFRITANVARAQHLQDAASANLQSSIRTLAIDVLRAYWTVRRAELQREVSRQALERFNDQVNVVAARVRAGLAPQVDLNRIETRRQREVARLADLDGAAAEGRVQLAVLLGLGGAALQLTEDADVPSPPPADAAEVDRVLAGARKGRPEVFAARMQTLAARDQVRVIESAYWPQLSASGLLQYGNNQFNPLVGARSANDTANPFANTSMSAFVGGTLSLNLFDTFNTVTSARDARYEVQRLEQEERRLGRLVEVDVRGAHARLLRAYRTREPLLKNRDLARDTLDIVERRYKNGDALILDYLDAQFDLFNAELDLVNANTTIAQTWGELQAATGRIPGRDQLP